MAETSVSTSGRMKGLLATPDIQKRFQEVLGTRANAFMSSIVSAYSANKSLSECEPMSVIASAMIAATLDLPINPSLGMAHIVPYKGVGTFQIGWKGFVQLALRSGQYKTIHVTPIYAGQIKAINQFTGDMEFNQERTSDTVIGYLLYFKLINGFEHYHYMTKEQCDAHGRRYSASYRLGKGKWVDQFDDMALKTVVKMGLSKFGILSIDMQTAIEKDESDGDKYPDSVQTSADTAPAQGPTRLHDLITDTQAEPAIPFGDDPSVPI